MANVKYISKVILSDGSLYYIKDSKAIRAGETVTGDVVIDGKIKANHLFIMSSEVVETAPANVLVRDVETGEVKTRDIDLLLKDIGGYSCEESDLENGILTLKLGK